MLKRLQGVHYILSSERGRKYYWEESQMPADGWAGRMASSKGTYTVSLFLLFCLLNLLVHFTYKWSGRISFSYLSLRIAFEDYLMNLTGHQGVGVVVFCLVTFALLRGILAMFGTRMQVIAWILLGLILFSALPILDFRRIFI
jgi:hypothetical protein